MTSTHTGESSSSSKKISYPDQDDSGVIPWAKEMIPGLVVSSLTVQKSSLGGRGLFASMDIKQGDTLLKVPLGAELSPESFFDSQLGETIDTLAKFVVALQHEKKLGRFSRWAVYIYRVPVLEDSFTPILWEQKELEMIKVSWLYQEVARQSELLNSKYEAVKKVFEGSIKEFKYMHHLVTSRALTSQKGDIVSLVPAMDFLNHDPTSKSVVAKNDGHSEVIADRDYSAGDEVLIKYGNYSNAELLLDYGFTMKNNAFDFVIIQLEVPSDTPLSNYKREILFKHGPQDMSDGTRFSFKFSRVPTYNFSEYGFPTSLLAFARVIACNNEAELDELRFEATMGWVPLKDFRKEHLAATILHGLISNLSATHENHIKELQENPPYAYFIRQTKRWELAQDLIKGEHAILESATSWLFDYCTWIYTIATS